MPWMPLVDVNTGTEYVRADRPVAYRRVSLQTGAEQLPIPPPSVLLAMEEVIAGARHLDAINADRAHRLAQDFCLTTIEELRFSSALDRLRLRIDALARAEAEAKNHDA